VRRDRSVEALAGDRALHRHHARAPQRGAALASRPVLGQGEHDVPPLAPGEPRRVAADGVGRIRARQAG
jgi:hypothetical protein